MFKLIITTFIIFYINNNNVESAAVVKPIEGNSIYWKQVGMKQLEKILKSTPSHAKKAKNIIVFIGDGMGLTTITAGRIYKGQQKGKSQGQQMNGEEETLVFENFLNTGLAKTYNVNKQVPDSASTATAIFTGVKTLHWVVGMDETCSPLDSKRGRLTSIMDWAIAVDKLTGLVTTTRVTHATPAALYANIYNRNWECDTEIPESSSKIYKDIARQLVEDAPGNKLNVILGGGLSPMGNFNESEVNPIKFGGSTENVCKRNDGRNLVKEWLNATEEEYQNEQEHRKFVSTRDELMNINTENVTHLLGLFRNNHITYAIGQQPEEPTLAEMVQQAIRILRKRNNYENNGFVLMVEGGRIDQAHHQNYAKAALREVLELDRAVQMALDLTDPEETLIIVTADHSHAMTLNGYPKRGTDILGFANESGAIPAYETITYANGPGFWDHRDFSTGITKKFDTGRKLDTAESLQNRSSPTYRHFAAFPLKDETHGGEDVIVFANGPGSHLIRGTFEQNYLAYVMSYSGCMGPAGKLNKACSSEDILELDQNDGDIIKSGTSLLVNSNFNLIIFVVVIGIFNYGVLIYY